MAEAALFSIAQTVLKQLGSKVLQEAALLWGMGDDVQKLTRTLSSIQAVLLDAEEQSHSPQSHQLRLWLKELRHVVYDAEDLLDDFSTEVLRRQGMATASEQFLKEVRSFFSSSNQVAYGLKIAHGIQAIRATLDEIAERREMFHLEVRPFESLARKQREQTHSGVPEMVVGREDDKEIILKLLLESKSMDKVLVVAIVGIGGLGKTTLAQLVYDDVTLKPHFELKVWVCVSDNFDAKLIVEKILESCTKQKVDKDLQMDTLRELLHKNVKGKRYMIVLDDVWSEDREKWVHLKSLLKGGAEGSCLLITTRLKKVAKLAAPRMEPYELKGLDESESWSLFREIAFEGGEVTSWRHELVGREIVEKCKGVPLAIKTVAGALFFKESESEWVAFKSKEMWKMDQTENDIMPTLKLSYDHLPTHLKHCFAYCGLFPKDYRIDVKTLIQIWIAQGFVQSSNPSDLFDVGVEYFTDLLWRSFFQETEKDKQGNIISCKMHDLMHDLALAVAGEEGATFNIPNSRDTQSYNLRLRGIRHVLCDLLNCQSNDETHKIFSAIVNNADAKKLQTLLGIYKPRAQYETEPINFSNTTRLRALDLSHFGMSMVSHTIHKLKHLRYLDFSHNNVEELPEEITELVNMEVLKLDYCDELEQLPRGMGKLSRVYHLGLEGCGSLTCLPLGIGRLCHLRELPLFMIPEGGTDSDAAAAGIGELQYLNNLRGRLMILNLERVKNPSEGVLANLEEKQHLKYLLLVWEEERVDFVDAAQGKLLEALRPHPNLMKLALAYNAGLECPSWLPSVRSLVKIEIVGCRNWKRLVSLDQLAFLAKLKLSDMDSLEYIECGQLPSSSSRSFFPSLKLLRLESCPKLKGWLTMAEAALPPFPCVSKVEIIGCGNITSIPCFSLELQHLELEHGSKDLLKQILMMPPPSSPPSQCSPPSFSGTSCLKHLEISKVQDIDTLPEEILPRLSSSSLKKLIFRNCPKLRTLHPVLPHLLTSLHGLFIDGCEELDLFDCDDDSTIAGKLQQLHRRVLMPSLLVVSLNGIPKLTHLPEWIQHATNLQQLATGNCPIKSIPEWMPKLTGLQYLGLRFHKKTVEQCMAEDWAKIGHIPLIYINDVPVQEGGRLKPLKKEQTQQNEGEAAAASTAEGNVEEEEEEETEVIVAEGEEEEEETDATEAEREEEEEKEACKLLQLFMNCSILRRCFQG